MSVTARKYVSLQALRGIAAMAVVLYHIGGTSGFEHKVWGERWAAWMYPGGLLGVDLFFVISGFIMVTTTAHISAGVTHSRAFLVRRLSRIYPAYLVATTLVFGLWLARPELVNSSQGDPDVVASFLLLPQENSPLLLVGWTLVHEMYFYLVFALALLLPRRGTVALLGAWGLVTVGLHQIATEQSSPWLQVAGSLLNLEFLLGAAAGWLVIARRPARPVVVLAGGLAGLVAGCWVALPDGALPADVLRCVGIAGALAVILYGVMCLELRHEWTPPQPLTTLGDFSYSLYLTHVLALAFMARAFSWVLPSGWLVHALGLLLAGAVCIGGAWAYYRAVERPSLTLAQRAIKRGGGGRESVPAEAIAA